MHVSCLGTNFVRVVDGLCECVVLHVVPRCRGHGRKTGDQFPME